MTRSVNDVIDEIRSTVRGERAAPPPPAVDTDYMRIASRLNQELIQAIVRERPASVSTLADITGQKIPNVSRALQFMASKGIVRLTREGKTVRPEVVCHKVEIDLLTGETKAVA